MLFHKYIPDSQHIQQTLAKGREKLIYRVTFINCLLLSLIHKYVKQKVFNSNHFTEMHLQNSTESKVSQFLSRVCSAFCPVHAVMIFFFLMPCAPSVEDGKKQHFKQLRKTLLYKNIVYFFLCLCTRVNMNRIHSRGPVFEKHFNKSCLSPV